MKKNDKFRNTERGIIILMLFLSTVFSFGQGNNWKLTENSIGNKDFLGTTNYKDLDFKTNDLLRMQISKDGNVSVLGNLSISNFLNVDSIKVRAIRIGDSSLWIGGFPSGGSGTYQDYIQSHNGRIIFGKYIASGYSSDIKIGIGNESPTEMLDVAGAV